MWATLGVFLSVFSLVVFLFLIVLDFSIWVLIFQGGISVLMLVYMIFSVIGKSSSSFGFKGLGSFKKFAGYYLVCEVFCEMLFLMGYLFHLSDLFSFLMFLKLGMFPFVYYFYFLLGVSQSKLAVSSMVVFYVVLGKIWAMCLFVVLPINISTLWYYVLFSTLYLCLDFSSSVSDFTASSFMLSETTLPVFCFVFPTQVVLFYVMTMGVIQVKVCELMVSGNKKIFESLLLTLTCGNPVFIFSWLKFLSSASWVKFGILKVFMMAYGGSVYLFFSLFIFMYNGSMGSNYKYYVILILCFMLGMSFFGGEINNTQEGFLYVNCGVLVWDLGCPSQQAFGDYLIWGSNLVLLIVVFFSMAPMYIYISTGKMGKTVFSSFMVSLEKGGLETCVVLEKGSGSVSVDYYQYFSFLLPLFGVVFSLSSNFILLASSQEGFFGAEGVMNMVGFQWGWEVFFIFFVLYSEDGGSQVLGGFINQFSKKGKEGCWGLETQTMAEGADKGFVVGGGNSTSFISVSSGKSFLVFTTSLDVIHSFGAPSLGMKMDSIPGHVNGAFLKVFGNSGDCFEFFCTELCGVNHPYMGGEILMVEGEEMSFVVGVKSNLFLPDKNNESDEDEGKIHKWMGKEDGVFCSKKMQETFSGESDKVGSSGFSFCKSYQMVETENVSNGNSLKSVVKEYLNGVSFMGESISKSPFFSQSKWSWWWSLLDKEKSLASVSVGSFTVGGEENLFSPLFKKPMKINYENNKSGWIKEKASKSKSFFIKRLKGGYFFKSFSTYYSQDILGGLFTPLVKGGDFSKSVLGAENSGFSSNGKACELLESFVGPVKTKGNSLVEKKLKDMWGVLSGGGSKEFNLNLKADSESIIEFCMDSEEKQSKSF